MDKFYLLVAADSSDAFWWSDDDGVPQAFDTEADAIERAKDNSLSAALVVRGVARITEIIKYKVERVRK